MKQKVIQKSADIPDYRIAEITYRGMFINTSSGKRFNNLSIPSSIIAKRAGEHWLKIGIKDDLLSIENKIKTMKPNTQLGFDCSDLKILLHGTSGTDIDILEINSRIDEGIYIRIRHIVRTKALNFILQLEKQIPAVMDIEVGAHPIEISSDDQKNIEHLTQQIFYGDVTNIHSNGDANSRVNLNSTDNSENVTK